MTSLTLAKNTQYTLLLRLCAIGGLLLAFALRLHRLGADSLWYDETVSVFLAQQSIPDLIAHTARDIHPPGYYILLHLWDRIAQPSLATGLEFLYAWPSLGWGVLLLALIHAVGRRFFDARIAITGLWLAAVNPYHIWYSQEVRMYTLCALLGLLCLWALRGELGIARAGRPITSSPDLRIANQRSLSLYTLAAAAGLYTAYYFAFLLIALNLLVLWSTIANSQSPNPNHHSYRPWLLANVAVLVLWLPWLPTFWRQMTEPPVPPWRGALDLPAVVQESLAALLVGQSPPLGVLWPWALVAGILLAAVIGLRRVPGDQGRMLVAFVFAPLLLILLISLTVTPLYHIRYFYIYAASGVLLVALGMKHILGRWRWLHAIALGGAFALSGWSLSSYWTSPLYQADDHRSAVSALAAAWRPGDAILVNAGWAYTALAVYWPYAPSPLGAQPLHPPMFTYLFDYTKQIAKPEVETPLWLIGGSVDGSPTLGWGQPESDFYAITRAETDAALAQVAAQHPRIWHYRIYDTVSDPSGHVRVWLDNHALLQLDQSYPGRDFLRLQRFDVPVPSDAAFCPQEVQPPLRFGSDLMLRGVWHSPAPQPGSMLYAVLCWEIGVEHPVENLRTSLRLYGGEGKEGELLAQNDEAPFLSFSTRSTGRTPLALPIPQSTPPGTYRLELIIYDGETGDPLPVDNPGAIYGQRWPLVETLWLGPRP